MEPETTINDFGKLLMGIKGESITNNSDNRTTKIAVFMT